ncbi:6-phosphofructo-2-kinase [Aureococcus anophagefferens]|nr:6-phosphofructo-2-kinase [Aureococcus anophagefferens]
MTELAGRLTVSNPVPQLPPGASSPRDNAALLHVAPNKSKYSTPSDKIPWLAEENDGRVAILDGTHSTLAKRNYAYDKLRKLDCKVIFLESICSDRDVVERNIVSCKLGTPDYVGMSERDAVEDFRRRVAQYESNYETIDADCLDGAESNRSWIKIIDCRRFVINNIRGYMPGRLVQFLSHLHMEPHVFYFSRHGQSEYNVLGKIGGDSGLSAAGDAYAKKLAEFCVSEVTKAPDGSERPARLWTSTMRRTRETAAYIAHEKTHIDYEGDDVGHAQEWVQLRPIAWSNLDEIFAGVCDGMTYAEIEEHYPEEFKRRQDDKLASPLPGGESTPIHRLDTMVHEMERHRAASSSRTRASSASSPTSWASPARRRPCPIP